MDLANATMYAATKIVDESLQQLATDPVGDERPFKLDEDDIQKVRLSRRGRNAWEEAEGTGVAGDLPA
jgi:hypothetical protein